MYILRIIFFSFLIVFSPALAYAEIQVFAPQKVSQGRAFLVSFENDSPFSGTLLWNEKEIPIQSYLNQDSHAAQALIACSRDDVGTLPLTFNPEGSKPISLSIETVPIVWKEDHIKGVAPAFITPPKEEGARIEKEYHAIQKILKSIEDTPSWSLPLYRPVSGTISSPFGGRRVYDDQPRASHKGTDMRGGIGVKIHSVAAGKVVIADSYYYSGNVIYIDHGQGVISAYAHMNKFAVKEGDFVEKGQYIGDMGATGRVTGPHLHLSLYAQGTPVDIVPLFTEPLEYVGEATKVQPRPTN